MYRRSISAGNAPKEGFPLKNASLESDEFAIARESGSGTGVEAGRFALLTGTGRVPPGTRRSNTIGQRTRRDLPGR